ncbi:hypothetical protein ACSNOK_02190 [Streptomyces sp. URMC 126]|uniref:hypothetical protein n=1 Tax=Streptomyces sp. URMC 126 TaxID=3423401 RepID=UPI003F1A7434
MAVWGLIVESTVALGDRKHIEARVLAQMRGEREDALARLEEIARNYQPTHPINPKRRRLFRNADGFLLVVDGSWQSHAARFTVARLLEDSARPIKRTDREPEPDAEREPRPEPEAEPRPEPEPEAEPEPRPGPGPGEPVLDADGVPVRPAWLGRKDLS